MSQSRAFCENLISRSKSLDISDVDKFISGISKTNPKNISSRSMNLHHYIYLFEIDLKYEKPDEIIEPTPRFKADNSLSHLPDNT